MRTRLCSLLTGTALLSLPLALTAQDEPMLLDPMSQPRFVNPLAFPGTMQHSGIPNNYVVSISQFDQWLGLYDPGQTPDLFDPASQLMTTVWGYNGSYPGPTIHARKNARVVARWNNNLVDANGQHLPHLLPVDQSLHWADPLGAHAMGTHPTGPYMGPVPIVTHLHGGHTESASDGLPDAWYTPGYVIKGRDYAKKNMRYDNDQEAATIWYHDHALGITRLNVYAGLAGFYLVHDAVEDQLIATHKLPAPAFEIPLAIQDRMFTMDGQLYMPSELNGMEMGDHMPDMPMDVPNPSVIAEFFGDHILVNGRAWPHHAVEPRKYRLRLLNGSDSRFYRLAFSNGMPFVQVATDEGFLPNAVLVDTLLIAPGERIEALVDFSAHQGDFIVLENYGPDGPFSGLPIDPADMADPETTGRLMEFRVITPLSGTPDATATVGTALRAPIAPLVQTGITRELVLLEGTDEYGRLKPSLGTVAAGALDWFAPTTENPGLGDVEVWEVYNATADAHPIHLHLVAFQILDRQAFTADVDPMSGALSNIVRTGTARPAEPNERGWKDTGVMYPGEVTRVIAKFDRKGLYVWHCHILSHEDHEMMRPFEVLNPGQARSMEAAHNEGPITVYPNPFTDAVSLAMETPTAGTVRFEVFDLTGRRVHGRILEVTADELMLTWDGRAQDGDLVAPGSYLFRLWLNGEVLHTGHMERMR